MVKRLLTMGLLSGLLVLGACQKHLDKETPSPEKQVQHLMLEMIGDMRTGQPQLERYGFPFWLDGRWLAKSTELEALFAESHGQPIPEVKELQVKLYPLTHLDTIRPLAWQRLQEQADPAFLARTQLAWVHLQTPEKTQAEESWLLVQQVDGHWVLVGLIED